MTEEQREKISKVYELVNRGEPGEREAAKAALDRLIKKYDLNSEDVESLTKKDYSFKYSNDLEVRLVIRIFTYFLPEKKLAAYKDTRGKREITISLEYFDFIIITSAYEYFRRHMMAQYKKVVLPQVNKCRKVKTKNKRRAQLQNLFFSNYVIASNLYNESEVKVLDPLKMSAKELSDRMGMMDVEGGNYHTQVSNGLYLES